MCLHHPTKSRKFFVFWRVFIKLSKFGIYFFVQTKGDYASRRWWNVSGEKWGYGALYYDRRGSQNFQPNRQPIAQLLSLSIWVVIIVRGAMYPQSKLFGASVRIPVLWPQRDPELFVRQPITQLLSSIFTTHFSPPCTEDAWKIFDYWVHRYYDGNSDFQSDRLKSCTIGCRIRKNSGIPLRW